MGELRNKLFLLAVVIAVISAIASCHAAQHSDSDYSENLSQQRPVHRRHKHHHHQPQHQHRLHSVSLGHRNSSSSSSSRYSLINTAAGSVAGNNYQPSPVSGVHHQQRHPTAGNTILQHSQPEWYHRTPQQRPQNRRTDSRTNFGGGARPDKRMLKHHHRNVTG